MDEESQGRRRRIGGSEGGNTPAASGRAENRPDRPAQPSQRTLPGDVDDTVFPIRTIGDIVNPNVVFPQWTEIFEAARNAFVDRGGDPTKPTDQFKTPEKFYELVSDVIREHPAWGLQPGDGRRLGEFIFDDLFSMGIIGRYLAIDGLEEVILNGHLNMFVIVRGQTVRVRSPFSNGDELRRWLQRVYGAMQDKPLNDEHPQQSGQLKDGSRIEAAIWPASLSGPSVTIRRKSTRLITREEYLAWRTFTQPTWDALQEYVNRGLNVLISGGTSTGKTSLLNVFLQMMPPRERIITVEDTPEITHRMPNMVNLVVPSAGGSAGEETVVGMARLIKGCLRMRPDRIVVGEVRGAEADAMLEGLNTGHDGSMATIHSNSARRALARLHQCASKAHGAGADESALAIWDSIANNIHIVVQIVRRNVNGKDQRFVSEIWQFGSKDMFDREDPYTNQLITDLQKRGLLKHIRPDGALIGWPLWTRQPFNADGDMVKLSDVVPVIGWKELDAPAAAEPPPA